eukprot:9289203-Lingulodinium_polyedra.AAC.1
MGGQPRSRGRSSSTSRRREDGDWFCMECGCYNFASRSSCYSSACRAAKPATQAPQGAGAPGKGNGGRRAPS